MKTSQGNWMGGGGRQLVWQLQGKGAWNLFKNVGKIYSVVKNQLFSAKFITTHYAIERQPNNNWLQTLNRRRKTHKKVQISSIIRTGKIEWKATTKN